MRKQDGIFEDMPNDSVGLIKEEKVDIVLLEYEDEEVSFNISFEFKYAFKRRIDKENKDE